MAPSLALRSAMKSARSSTSLNPSLSKPTDIDETVRGRCLGWNDVAELGELLGEDGAAPESEEQGGRFFSRLRDSLSKSRRALTGEIASAVVAFDPNSE